MELKLLELICGTMLVTPEQMVAVAVLHVRQEWERGRYRREMARALENGTPLRTAWTQIARMA